MSDRGAIFLAGVLSVGLLCGQTADNVLVVVNDSSALSRSVGEYYARKRAIPVRNICHIKAGAEESISRDEYNRRIAEFLVSDPRVAWVSYNGGSAPGDQRRDGPFRRRCFGGFGVDAAL